MSVWVIWDTLYI